MKRKCQQTLSPLASQSLAHLSSLAASQLYERLGEAAYASNAEWAVYVPANRPFIDPPLTPGMLAKPVQGDSYDYVGYRTGNGAPLAMDKLGLTGEACQPEPLSRLRIPEPLDRVNLRFSLELQKEVG